MFRKLFPIYLVIFFGYIGYSLITTVFTPMLLHLENDLLPSYTPVEIRVITLGCLIFLYPFVQFLSSPVLGAFSDRFGRRPILLFSLLITAMMYALVGLGVEISSLPLIAIALFIAGLSEGNVTIAKSTVSDLTPPQKRS